LTIFKGGGGKSVRKIIKQLAIVIFIVFFAFGVNLENSFARRGGFSRSSFSRSRSYSSGRSYRPSRSSSRSTSKSYSSSRKSTSRVTKPRTSTTKSVKKSYGKSNYSRSTTTPKKSTAFSRSRSTRQKRQAMSQSRTSTAVSTKGMSSRDKRAIKASNRKYNRQLKAENRRLKRQVRRADRNTARERRQNRIANQTTIVNHYPVATYSTSLWTMASIMAFNNLYMGIYFHDYYNHAFYHSWLWYYHHPDYDRTHWSRERQMEYERWRAYYDSQGIEPNPNYVDPETHKDEDYVESYVEKNTDEFYGPDVQEYTVEELPDESELPQLVTVSQQEPINRTVKHETTKTIVVKKKTSGAVWFVLIFGALIVVGIIALVMYNRGYF